MIKEEDLLDAIAECQGERNPTANTCRNLAAFYTIVDHVRNESDTSNIETYSYSDGLSSMPTIEYDSGSEFSEMIRGKNINEILSVIDELMETLSIVNPRLYAGVLRKL